MRVFAAACNVLREGKVVVIYTAGYQETIGFVTPLKRKYLYAKDPGMVNIPKPFIIIKLCKPKFYFI